MERLNPNAVPKVPGETREMELAKRLYHSAAQFQSTPIEVIHASVGLLTTMLYLVPEVHRRELLNNVVKVLEMNVFGIDMTMIPIDGKVDPK